MPQYEARCNICGAIHDYIKPASQYLDTPECCGQKTEKVILTAPYGQVDIPAYQSPVSGRWINSRRERTEDLKRNNCRPWEGMEQEQKEAARRASYDEQKQDAAIEKTVVDAWRQLTPEKQAVLNAA